MNVFQIKELLPSPRSVVAIVNVDARAVTAYASACRMGADATARGSMVMVPATRISNRRNGGTTAAQSKTAYIVDATIAARSFATPRVHGPN